MVLYNHGKQKSYSDIRKVVYYMMYTTKEMITMVNELLDEICQIFGLENDETIKFATLCEDFINNIDNKNEIDSRGVLEYLGLWMQHHPRAQ